MNAGVTVLRKGQEDMVSCGGDVYTLVNELGSPRRCGGQVITLPLFCEYNKDS